MTAAKHSLSNKVRAILDADITTSTTSILVNDGSVFPANAFHIIIDAEIMLCTSRSSNTLTVVRAQDDTPASAHLGGAVVGMPVCPAALTQMCYHAGGPCNAIYPRKPLVAATDFTWANQGTSTVADNTWGGIVLKAQSASPHSCRCLYKTAPSAPYTLTTRLMTDAHESGTLGSHWGMFFKDSGDTKMFSASYRADNIFAGWRWNSPTSFATQTASSDAVQESGRSGLWFQLEDDNTTLYIRFSEDGVNFFELYNVARTDWFTSPPDQVGFYLSNHQVDGLNLSLSAWIEE